VVGTTVFVLVATGAYTYGSSVVLTALTDFLSRRLAAVYESARCS